MVRIKKVVSKLDTFRQSKLTFQPWDCHFHWQRQSLTFCPKWRMAKKWSLFLWLASLCHQTWIYLARYCDASLPHKMIAKDEYGSTFYLSERQWHQFMPTCFSCNKSFQGSQCYLMMVVIIQHHWKINTRGEMISGMFMYLCTKINLSKPKTWNMCHG